jgi:PAS domain S-box-containing protein
MKRSELVAFDAVDALIVVLDVDQRIVHWNRACSELTGYTLEEVRGRRLRDFILPPDESQPLEGVITGRSAQEHQPRFESVWVTKRGERRCIAWSTRVVRHPDGRVRYIIETGIDRTDNKRLEDALRASEATLGRLISIAGDAIISLDREQRIAIYNHGAEEIFGWSATEVIGKPVEMLLPERLRHTPADHVRGLIASEVEAKPMRARIPEIIGLRKSGEEFPAQASVSKLDVGGDRLFTFVLRDVTEQKQRESERELLSRLGAVLLATFDADEILVGTTRAIVGTPGIADCCAMVIFGEDKPPRIELAHRDPAKKRLCDRLREMALDLPLDRMIESALESKQAPVITEPSFEQLAALARNDQNLRVLKELDPHSLLLIPLSARGELTGALCFISSEPSRRYGKRELRLAEEIAVRTALAIEGARLYEDMRSHGDDLREVNQRLIQATVRSQELAEEADEAKARAEQSERELSKVGEFREMFIGIVMHDLRNPISSINVSAAMLRRYTPPETPASKAITRIESSAERMTRMISQLLDLTRARLGGGFPVEPVRTDLGELCLRVVEEFSAAIRVEIQGDVTGRWDPDRLEEALSNIVGNAVDHASAGTVVDVEATADGDDVVVSITNQGSAIPPEVLPVIFEPFHGAKRHKGSATGHLGLGLYIAHQIVLSHGGTLSAASAGGKTIFVMRLPRGPRREMTDGSAPQADSSASSTLR